MGTGKLIQKSNKGSGSQEIVEDEDEIEIDDLKEEEIGVGAVAHITQLTSQLEEQLQKHAHVYLNARSEITQVIGENLTLHNMFKGLLTTLGAEMPEVGKLFTGERTAMKAVFGGVDRYSTADYKEAIAHVVVEIRNLLDKVKKASSTEEQLASKLAACQTQLTKTIEELTVASGKLIAAENRLAGLAGEMNSNVKTISCANSVDGGNFLLINRHPKAVGYMISGQLKEDGTPYYKSLARVRDAGQALRFKTQKEADDFLKSVIKNERHIPKDVNLAGRLNNYTVGHVQISYIASSAKEVKEKA